MTLFNQIVELRERLHKIISDPATSEVTREAAIDAYESCFTLECLLDRKTGEPKKAEDE